MENIYKKKLDKKSKINNVVVGYLADNNKLKIVDNRKYTEALTLGKKRSKRSLITGRICLTFTINTLLSIAKTLNVKDISIKNRDVLCFYIEILLRYNNMISSNKIYFINKY